MLLTLVLEFEWSFDEFFSLWQSDLKILEKISFWLFLALLIYIRARVNIWFGRSKLLSNIWSVASKAQNARCLLTAFKTKFCRRAFALVFGKRHQPAKTATRKTKRHQIHKYNHIRNFYFVLRYSTPPFFFCFFFSYQFILNFNVSRLKTRISINLFILMISPKY